MARSATAAAAAAGRQGCDSETAVGAAEPATRGSAVGADPRPDQDLEQTTNKLEINLLYRNMLMPNT